MCRSRKLSQGIHLQTRAGPASYQGVCVCVGGGGSDKFYYCKTPTRWYSRYTHSLTYPRLAISLLDVRGMINYQKINRSEKHAKKARDWSNQKQSQPLKPKRELTNITLCQYNTSSPVSEVSHLVSCLHNYPSSRQLIITVRKWIIT